MNRRTFCRLAPVALVRPRSMEQDALSIRGRDPVTLSADDPAARSTVSHVTVDGVLVDNCTFADEVEGFVRYLDPTYLAAGEIVPKTRHGFVHVHLRPPGKP